MGGLILGGYDELPDSCRHDDSIFVQVIAGKLLPLTTVLVTSRSWAPKMIHLDYGNHIYQHTEILGFTSHQITEYIESTLPQDKVRDLSKYISAKASSDWRLHVHSTEQCYCDDSVPGEPGW